MWTRCTSSSEKKKKLEVFETRINHFKSCKTSLFLLFPLLLRLICEAERQSFGELQKSHPNTSLAYFWQILSKLFPLFSLPTDHSKRSFWEEREKKQVSSLCGAFAICDPTAFMKSRYFPSSGGAHAASMSSRSCGWMSKQNHNHNFGKGQDVKHFSRYKGLTYYLWPQKKYCFGIDFHQSTIRRAFEFWKV